MEIFEEAWLLRLDEGELSRLLRLMTHRLGLFENIGMRVEDNLWALIWVVIYYWLLAEILLFELNLLELNLLLEYWRLVIGA